jgi:hypothetical protein
LIRGTFDEFSLPDIVGLLSRTGKTGALELSGPDGSGRIYFSEGAICGARCTRGREPLGRKLVRADVLTETQLQAALARQGQGRLRLGESLVRDGAVAHPEIEAALEEQIQDSIVGLLGLKPTEFSWTSQIPEEVTVAVDADRLLTAVEANLHELEDIRTRIPTDDVNVGLNPVPPEGLRGLNISPEEWRVMAMLGARRSVGDLVRYSGSGDIHALRTIDALLKSGLLEVTERPRTAPAPPALREVPPPPPGGVPSGVRVEGVPRSRVIRLVEPTGGPKFKIAIVSSSDPQRGSETAAMLREASYDLPVEIGLLGAGEPDEERATDADLVLALDRYDKKRAVLQNGARLDVTFTILELAGLLESHSGEEPDPIDRWRLAVRRANRLRLTQPPPAVNDTSIAVRNAGSVEAACRRLTETLFGRTKSRK